MSPIKIMHNHCNYVFQKLENSGYQLDRLLCKKHEIVFYKNMPKSRQALKIISIISIIILSLGVCLCSHGFRTRLKNSFRGRSFKVLIATDFTFKFDTETNKLILSKVEKKIPTIHEIMDTEGINLLKNILKAGPRNVTLNNQRYYLKYEKNNLVITTDKNTLEIPFTVKDHIASLKEVTEFDLAKDESPLSIPLADIIRWAYEVSSTYDNYGAVHLLKNSLRIVPEYHLASFVNRQNGVLSVSFLKIDLSRGDGADAGGLKVDYYSDLMKGLMECRKISFKTFFSDMLVPQAKANHIEGNVVTRLSAEENEIYFNFGNFLRAAYDNQMVLGKYLHDSLFKFIAFFGLNQRFSTVQHRPTMIQNLSRWVTQVISLSEVGKGKIEEETKFDPLLIDFCKMFIEICDENEYICEHKLLLNCLVKEEWTDDECSRIAATAEVYECLSEEFLDEDGFANYEVVLAKKDLFKDTLKPHLLNFILQMLVKNVQISKLFEPILAIQKGFNKSPQSILTKANYKSISVAIQGSTDRQKIVASFVNQSRSSVIAKKIQWLKEWILDSTTTEDELKSFLKFVLGVETLSMNRLILIKEQVNKFIPAPEAHTCFGEIHIAPRFCGKKEYNDRDKESFIKVIKTYCLGNTTYQIY